MTEWKEHKISSTDIIQQLIFIKKKNKLKMDVVL